MENDIESNEQIVRIDHIIENLTQKGCSKYKIYWFKKLTRKVAQYQDTCPTCAQLKNEIDTLSEELEKVEKDSMHVIENYDARIKVIYNHLKQAHHVVPDHHYMHVATVVGVIIGVGVSIAAIDKHAELEKYGLWGCALAGLLLGKYLDYRAIGEDRTLW